MHHFASDNYAEVHPEIFEALAKANQGHASAYGSDEHTADALRKFKETFGEDSETFFVFNGTAANVLSLKALSESYHSIICTDVAHVQSDECGAPEKFLGCKLIALPSSDGKLTIETLKKFWETGLAQSGEQHHSQARVITITQSTEFGTVYSREEIARISEFAKAHSLYLHMVGSRISNAAASLDCTFKELTADLGVDVLSFGGTKNGLLYGEAVVFLKKNLARDFQYIRKQGMQLASKMRFISAQFEVLLSGMPGQELWRINARHANAMAKKLESALAGLAEVKISRPAQANAVFATLPRNVISELQKIFSFYIWGSAQEATRAEVRWMASFNTTAEDVEAFVEALKTLLTKVK
ncbi:MAG: low specificity L-threonine aldolase [Methylotenera sp.]|nr:low specificity L-threonine aldolase [Oligoflexia bacterium]